MENQILIQSEAEAFIECLEVINVNEIGSPRWLCQHERLYKLSIQATLSAQKNEEEFVKDLIVSCDKISIIIIDLLITELWKEKVLPEIGKLGVSVPSVIPIYTVIYHEGIIATLLEALLFHDDIIDSASEILIDLIDYCHRKILTLLGPFKDDKKPLSNSKNNEELKELQEKNSSQEFEIRMKSISFLSCIIQHIKTIPLSCLHRLLNTHDIPMLFTSLIDETPWIRTTDDEKTQKYSEGKWTVVKQVEMYKLSKLEGQVWFALILLLLNADCLKKYEINEYRRCRLLKLKSKINEVMTNQIPVLQEFLRFLEHITLGNPPTSKPDIIIEQVSEREILLKKYGKNWSIIAQQQMENYFSPSSSELRDMCQRLSDAYDMEKLESVLPGKPQCVMCYKTGEKKCSRCKNEWYCGRKCQVAHWQKHKPVCDLLATNKS